MPPTFRPSTSYAPLMPIQFAPPGPATPPRPTSQSSPTVPPVPSTWLVPQTTERDSSGAPEPSSCRRPHLMYAHGSGPTRCGAMRSSKRDAPFARMPPADSLEPNARWQAKLHYPGINRVVSTFTNRRGAIDSLHQLCEWFSPCAARQPAHIPRMSQFSCSRRPRPHRNSGTSTPIRPAGEAPLSV